MNEIRDLAVAFISSFREYLMEQYCEDTCQNLEK